MTTEQLTSNKGHDASKLRKNWDKMSCNWKALVKVSSNDVCHVSHVSATAYMFRQCRSHQKRKRDPEKGD